MQTTFVIPSREKDLGDLVVRRVLPYASHRMVGPFIFFDHMGPVLFSQGKGMEVRPHPHIHLATVTYLFEGKIHHRDSLGSDQMIEPGAINWMIAGRGIVHSERTPSELISSGSGLNGIQCWVALPAGFEDIEPSFTHHPSQSLPEFVRDQVRIKLLLGKALGFESPVGVQSDLFYLDVFMPKGTTLKFPLEKREGAGYLVSGKVMLNDIALESHSMALGGVGEDLLIIAKEDSRLMLLGGTPLGERFMYWNFVSSSKESIEQAKREWAKGPSGEGGRFPKVIGDGDDYIPLPQDPSTPGTAL